MTTAVRTRPMTEEEYADYRVRSLPTYAIELERARGLDHDAAMAESTKTFAPTLAEASAAERTWVLRVLDDTDAPVGWLWLGPQPHRADALFIYDIEIDEAHRGRGLGRATMLAVESIARDAGLTGIGLNVFGGNEPAQALYQSLGYRMTAMQMTKRLTDQP